MVFKITPAGVQQAKKIVGVKLKPKNNNKRRFK
jgi:hypothetical protein